MKAEKYIALLRGINVSGQKLIKMDALRRMFSGLNFTDVQTYLQSGNVVFSALETNVNGLEKQIAFQIEKDFGFDVPVIVLGVETLRNTIESNPFVNDKAKDTLFMHITFLAEIPKDVDKQIIESKKQVGEEVTLADKVIYIYCPNGYGKTKLNKNFLNMVTM